MNPETKVFTGSVSQGGAQGASPQMAYGAAAERKMRFAYADPPYIGLAAKFYGHLHPDAADYDKPETHQALIDRMCDEFSDGWALSLHSPALRTILPMCPLEARVMAWVKPFASFKPGVGVAYAWEPIIVMGGRRRTRAQSTVRDWCAANITLRKGLTGAKPAGVVHWLLDVLGAEREDEICDLFPGSGAVSMALDQWRESMNGRPTGPLFAEDTCYFTADAARCRKEALEREGRAAN